MRTESRVTSISWIPSEAVTGGHARLMTTLSHYDDPLPDHFESLEDLRRADRFRFANVLGAWAQFDGDRATDYGYTAGGVMGSTTARFGPLGLTLHGVSLPDIVAEPEVVPGSVTFRQTTGGRTAAPLPRAIPRPPFVRIEAPLVWTTLELTLFATGESRATLVGASPFPRHWIYDADNRITAKAGLADWQKWLSQGSEDETPWGSMDAPVIVTAAESALERELSADIMGGLISREVLNVEPGTVLMAQGEPGDSIALILDGVVDIEVDGTSVGELGPGAVIGERAGIASGVRSATVTAVTPVRIAQVESTSLDRTDLVELSALHNRESEQPAP